MPLTQASLSICSSTACQPSTIKLPVHFRPNHAERKSLSREAASCEGWGVTTGLFVFIFWRIMKSGMHVCSPDLPHSKLLSKHPHLHPVSPSLDLQVVCEGGVESNIYRMILRELTLFYADQFSTKLWDTGAIILFTAEETEPKKGQWSTISDRSDEWILNGSVGAISNPVHLGSLGAKEFKLRIAWSSGNIPFRDLFQGWQ